MNRGDVISNKYEVIENIGFGGMGKVVKVVEMTSGLEYALKYCVETDDGSLRRFGREVRIMQATVHPNVIQVIDSDLTHVPPYFTMPIASGSLNKFLPQIKNNLGAIMPIFDEICKGITAMHTAGHFHRDIKPPNVLIMKTGEVVVTDFGLSKMISPDSPAHPSSNHFIGTYGYHAPEQFDGSSADARTDIFQLGKTFYELYTGEYPHLINPAKITTGLNYILQTATSNDPNARYKSVGALQQALKTYQLSLNPKSNPQSLFENKLNEAKTLMSRGQLDVATNLALLEALELVKDDHEKYLMNFDRIPATIIKAMVSQMDNVFENTLNVYTKNLGDFFDKGQYDFTYAEKVADIMSAIFSASTKIEIKIKALKNILVAAVRCGRYYAMDKFDLLLKSIKNDVEAIAVADLLNREMDYYTVVFDRVPQNSLHYIIQPAWTDADTLSKAAKEKEIEERQKMIDFFDSQTDL